MKINTILREDLDKKPKFLLYFDNLRLVVYPLKEEQSEFLEAFEVASFHFRDEDDRLPAKEAMIYNQLLKGSNKVVLAIGSFKKERIIVPTKNVTKTVRKSKPKDCIISGSKDLISEK